MISNANLDSITQQLRQLDPADSAYATQFVAALIAAAQSVSASDVHLTPNGVELEIRWRLDGVLHGVGAFPSGSAADIVSRLKVMADLLTYRSDVPQEGRIRQAPGGMEMRVSTFPTLHGERAVIRLFAAEGRFLFIDDLELPGDLAAQLHGLIRETSGALLISGPAGSGKTTTAYACLRELVRASEGGKSLVSLEDPIEVAVPGVAQSQVKPAAGFDLAKGLRSIMRQDPEVILIGEIRDQETAETALQASLTGHLVMTTFHAGSAAEAVNRLADMSIEPYLLRSGILAILSQRLLRRLCSCARVSNDDEDRLGLPVARAGVPMGCAECLGTGYRGRIVIAELFMPQRLELGRANLSHSDAAQLERLACDAGMLTRWQRACQAVEAGQTSAKEVRRVLGFS